MSRFMMLAWYSMAFASSDKQHIKTSLLKASIYGKKSQRRI